VGCIQNKTDQTPPTTQTPTTQTTPSEIHNKMYFFYKDGCPACEKVKPTVSSLAEKINIIFCNVKEMNSECLNVSKSIKLYAVPTMAIKQDGSFFEVYVGADRISELLKSYE